MLGRRVLRIGPERLHQRVPRKDVIAHRCERLIRRVRQPRRVGGFLQEILDAFVLAGINDAESTGLAAGYTDARDRTAESGIDVSIHHLLDVHPVDVVRAEHDDIVGIGITDQVERLVDGVGGSLIPTGTQTLLSGNGRHVGAHEG